MAKFRYISPDEVMTHNTERSCWLILANKVYDVSDYIHEHPGGYDILLNASGEKAAFSCKQVT